jgi:hypothetical protein
MRWLFLLFVFVVPTYAQDVVLETDDFRLTFDQTSIITSCEHIPTGTFFEMRPFRSNIANTGPDETWDYPEQTLIEIVDAQTKRLTYVYGPDKSSTVLVVSHPSWLEFILEDVTGDCGQVRIFGPIWYVDNVLVENIHPITSLGNSFFAACLPLNTTTRILRSYSENQSTHMLYVITPEPDLPSPEPPVSRFGFFLCRNLDLYNHISAVQEASGITPVVNSIAPENRFDYVFLLSQGSPTTEEIIEMCQSMGIHSILLSSGNWSDWGSPIEPYEVRPNAPQLIADLQAAGFTVGLHTYVHKVPVGGYYENTCPEHINMNGQRNGRRNLLWNDNFPEMLAMDFVDKVEQLGVSWLYFDGSEGLWTKEIAPGIWDETYDYQWHLNSRMTYAIMHELETRGLHLPIHQQSSSGVYMTVTRRGQIDYWDDQAGIWSPESIWHSPIDGMEKRAALFPEYKSKFVNPDLGWFGRIHVTTGGVPFYEDRYATWEEWQRICELTYQHFAALGIRTGFAYFRDDPLHDSIVELVRNTIAHKQIYFDGTIKQPKYGQLLTTHWPNEISFFGTQDDTFQVTLGDQMVPVPVKIQP